MRNPVGSRHEPRSDEGAVILVKLWWMHPEDQDFVRVDMTREDLWRPSGQKGVEVMALHAFEAESNALFRLAPGASLPARSLPGGEEIYVMAGSCRDGLGDYGEGTWLRNPIGEASELASESGCRLYVKSGHLKNLPPTPGDR